MSVSKKIYQQVADVMNEEIYHKNIAERLAYIFEEDNPRFDRVRFLAACGYPPDQPFKYEGSVSTGTLRSEDLVAAFAPILKDLDPARYYEIMVREVPTASDLYQEVVNDLMDALDDNAPEGYYFGAIEGDGSDFGFWKVEDEYSLSDCANWETNSQGDCGGRVERLSNGVVLCENCRNHLHA